ncbi:Toluene-4-sulfonate monooxygenase system iron-sulfur subunit TsaM1 [compost metagenome]
MVTAFDEDRDIITAQQRSLALAPDFKMVPLSIDAALSQFRWVVSRRVEEERQAAPAVIPIATAQEVA